MSINQVFSVSQPQYNNLWEFAIVPDILSTGLSAVGPVDIGRAIKMRLLAQSLTIPFLGFETEKRSTGTTHFSGYTPESSISVTFYETKDFTVLNYFENWRDTIYDQDRRVWKKGNNRRWGIITLLQPVFSGLGGRALDAIGVNTPQDIAGIRFQPSKIYRLSGLVPTSIGDIELSYDNGEAMTITVEFELDQCEDLTRKAKSWILDSIGI